MSRGVYKRTSYHIQRIKEGHQGKEKPELSPRICLICGKQYIPHHNSQKYCSYACSYQFRKGKTWEEIYGVDGAKRFRENVKNTLMKLRENRFCLECGKVFEAKVDSARKFCSRPCVTKYYWQTRDNSERCKKIGKTLDRKVTVSCTWCGKQVKVHQYYSRRENTFCSKECHGKWRSANFSEENNPNWQGGFSDYPFSFDEDLKRFIRERDHDTCQLCSKTQKELGNESQQKLCVHHINHDKDDLFELNLITLCRSCNGKVNSRRDFWEGYFTFNLLHGIILGE